MALPEYIEKIGVEKFSKKTGIPERTVRSWKYRARRPNRETAKQLAAIIPLKIEDILFYTVKSKRTQDVSSTV